MPTSGPEFVALLQDLVGADLNFRCARGDAKICRTHRRGPCPSCVAEDHVAHLARSGTPWSVAKLNQLVVLVGQKPVSEDFFRLFFGADRCADPEFLAGLANFRAYAMLAFGSFKSAFTALGSADETVIRQKLERWEADPAKRLADYNARPHGTTLVVTIDDADRPFLGYLSIGRLEKDIALSAALDLAERDATKLTDDHKKLLARLTPQEQAAWTTVLGEVEEQLASFEDRVTQARQRGLANTAAYLAANHVDVYVATSMREDSEFFAVAAFVRDVERALRDSLTKRAKAAALPVAEGGVDITFFDPTLSYSADRIDKGLVEGLMLRRADCTLYMVQETDTLGKDSELATTLARGRVVVAFVPRSASASAFRSTPDMLKKRVLNLLADGHFAPEKVSRVYKLLDPLVNEPKVFTLIDPALASSGPGPSLAPADLTFLIEATVEAEDAALRRRAESLATGHPLALQLELTTGVANGVLVAREPAHCAMLVERTLLNTHEFDIVEQMDKDGVVPVATVLRERTTGCAFRVVTRDPVLTNAFWSRYPQ